MPLCRICRTETVRNFLDFGQQPICHRFLGQPESSEVTHRLAIGVCEACATVQLIDPPPGQKLKPIYSWVFYNEPERHLDDVADRLAVLPGLKKDDPILGVSYKDESTLTRLKTKGFTNTCCADLKEDYGILEKGGGVETIQAKLTRETARKIAQKHGRQKVVLFRHILEHCFDLYEVGLALKELLTDDGVLMVEMPDASRALDHLDYTTIWEEHIFYFTPGTLQGTLARLGFRTEFVHSYPYSHENSLVAFARPSANVAAATTDLPSETRRAQRFLAEFPNKKESILRTLSQFRNKNGEISFLGAGHLTCTFLNIMDLRNVVRFVVDDDMNKNGLYMPGSKLPILASKALLEKDVKLCLFSVRPEIEEMVVKKNQAFVDQGGKMGSIFPKSPFAFPFC